MSPCATAIGGEQLADLLQTGIAGKAKDVAAALIFQQFHDLRRAVMTIAMHGNFHPGPVAPDAANDVLEDTDRLFPGRPLAASKMWMGWKQY